MITIDELKKELRISHSALDDKLQRDVEACLLDMSRVGIDTSKDDMLIDTAISLYVHSRNDLVTPERYEKNYKELRDAISVCETYAK